LVGGVTLDVTDCTLCPDPSSNGCLPDLSYPDGGQFACVCPADGGGNAFCQGVPGSDTSTLCLDLGGGTNLCGTGTPMIWDPKLGFYVVSENCIIRSCTGTGGVDGGAC
jgi:hypothetical protein